MVAVLMSTPVDLLGQDGNADNRPVERFLLVLRPANAEFSVGEPVTLRIVLTNVGTVPLKVPAAFREYSSIHIMEKGKWTVCTKADPRPHPSQPIAAQELQPKEVWEIGKLHLDMDCGLTKPGQYHVSLYYSMPPNLGAGGPRDEIYADFWEGELGDAAPFKIVPPTEDVTPPAAPAPAAEK